MRRTASLPDADECPWLFPFLATFISLQSVVEEISASTAQAQEAEDDCGAAPVPETATLAVVMPRHRSLDVAEN